ncbi:receptor-interacting serine/threonine-protein kinase 3-like [Spea bombifrons]|uniref:receptor-interacting serine/threonine-protein kinase 3-like n=1 Tax=Spea bombifrons TaxID=233779 RepID=UPI002349F334|nr:receptor-interacting serine/threonine-protein kinase 3-like [Spea bombifrons]
MLILRAGDLESLDVIGSGGFGVVYKGWSRTLNTVIALKMIQGSDLKLLLKEIEKEGLVMQKASNPHVLRLLAVYEKKEGTLLQHGLVMEYMPHGSLRSLYQNNPEVPWALRFRILNQVVLGMNYLHNLDPPIIHRDLKPGNILLNKYLDVQITDFGLSKVLGATTTTQPSMAGTLAYMPPEAFSHIHYKPTKAYDVYSFGILMWSVFSGEEPYLGVHPLLIQRFVSEGQRPDESILEEWNEVKMLPEARTLMKSCWSPKAEDRPSFHYCSEPTGNMAKGYEGEIDKDVQKVLEHLKESYSKDETSISSLVSLDDFSFRGLEITEGQIAEPQESAPEHTGMELASEVQGDAASSEEHKSSAEIVINTIKESGDFKKIVGNLSDDGILGKAEKEVLEGSRSLKEIGRTVEKVVSNTIKERPEKLLVSLKKLWK